MYPRLGWRLPPALSELEATAYQLCSPFRNSSPKTIGHTHNASIDRPSMVDIYKSNKREWHTHYGTDQQPVYTNRCIPARLGSSLSRSEDRGILEQRRTAVAHQYARTEGGLSCHPVVLEYGLATLGKTNSVANGQLDGSGLRKQTGRDQIERSNEVSFGHVGIVPGEEHNLSGTTLARNSELSCRCRVTTTERQNRVDSRQRDLWENPETLLQPAGGPFCVQTESSTPVVRRPDPSAMAINGFTLDWSQWTSLIYPPIVLLNRILLKIRQDRATALVIAPAWAGQPWYPTLLEMLVDFPAKLPRSETTLFLPFDKMAVHPLWKTLALTVWPLSGEECKQQDFQRRCAMSSWLPGERVLQRDTQDLGRSGLAGVLKGRSVPFQHL